MAGRGREPGAVVKSDLRDGRMAYGRQLEGVEVEFFDLAVEAELTDVQVLRSTPVAFRLWVMDRAFRRNHWPRVGALPLADSETGREQRYFRQDALSGELFIYTSRPATGESHETPATGEELRGLECAAVWGPEHVEDRLRDHFDGRPNGWEQSLRPRPSPPG
jgi:hypothetical protein